MSKKDLLDGGFRRPEFVGLRSAIVPHEPVDLHFGDEPSRTRQEFLEDADINTIMARFEGTGVMDNSHLQEPVYYDFTTMPTNLMESLDVMRSAEEAFMALPAVVRREFENDPRQFLDFASDPENLSQMRTWGLAPQPEAPKPPLEVRVIPDPSPAPPPGDAPKAV